MPAFFPMLSAGFHSYLIISITFLALQDLGDLESSERKQTQRTASWNLSPERLPVAAASAQLSQPLNSGVGWGMPWVVPTIILAGRTHSLWSQGCSRVAQTKADAREECVGSSRVGV